jgi:MoaA/NifB/PqqE/SkfB family radical SAM enzyme
MLLSLTRLLPQEQKRQFKMPNELSGKLLMIFFKNYFKIRFRKHKILEPLFFTFYNTLKCNFSCTYCNFAKGNKDLHLSPELDTRETMRLLQIIKLACPNIYVTGGEPLLRSDIVDVLKYCHQIGFRSISINTNMSLIHKRVEILDYITNLVASFDIMDRIEGAKIYGVSQKTIKQTKDNIISCAKLQKSKKFKMTINCVVIPQTISHVKEVMNFCFEHDMRFAIVPAELDSGKINNLLMNNKEYQNLIRDIIKAKEDGRPVFGSKEYLETILNFKPFKCFPTLTPHIYPNGDLFYPCEPMHKIGGNLLVAGSYKTVLKKAIERFGPLPFCKDKCYKACYIEPYIFMKNPLLIIKEAI